MGLPRYSLYSRLDGYLLARQITRPFPAHPIYRMAALYI